MNNAIKLPLYKPSGSDCSSPTQDGQDSKTSKSSVETGDIDKPLDHKLELLRIRLNALENLVVGFSGGIDSTFLLKIAFEQLGQRCIALTAVGPSLGSREREETRRIAKEIGVRHLLRESDEIHNPAYASNPVNRCYHCRQALFDLADILQTEEGFGNVAIGTIVDDLKDHRPGLQAASERGVLHPLAEAGLTKRDIRLLSRRMGIDIWDKPALACLSSRFPYGVEITPERLGQIETCENLLDDLGFSIFRVRFHHDLVRIEFGQDEIQRAFSETIRAQIITGCKSAGFKYISVDLQGYRSGSMNEALP